MSEWDDIMTQWDLQMADFFGDKSLWEGGFLNKEAYEAKYNTDSKYSKDITMNDQVDVPVCENEVAATPVVAMTEAQLKALAEAEAATAPTDDAYTAEARGEAVVATEAPTTEG
tara:strand:- start:4446 stop:4787 length:342 start_codon:yes stop_codon:yes gene_type:complete